MPDTNHSASAGQLRIVSLSPAISRTLVDFELQHQIVGRSQFCTALDASIPIVGDLGKVDYEQLIRIRPTHILLQPPASGVDHKLEELATSRSWKMGKWPFLNGVDDITRLIEELPHVLYSPDTDELTEALAHSAALLQSLNRALELGGKRVFNGRVLMLSSLEPVMAFGRDTYLHDILIRFGGENAVSAKGWVQLSMEDVVRVNPDAVLLVVDSPPESAPRAAAALASFQDLDIVAAREKRLAVMAHRDALLPSSGIIKVALIMRDGLHEFTDAPK